MLPFHPDFLRNLSTHAERRFIDEGSDVGMWNQVASNVLDPSDRLYAPMTWGAYIGFWSACARPAMFELVLEDGRRPNLSVGPLVIRRCPLCTMAGLVAPPGSPTMVFRTDCIKCGGMLYTAHVHYTSQLRFRLDTAVCIGRCPEQLPALFMVYNNSNDMAVCAPVSTGTVFINYRLEAFMRPYATSGVCKEHVLSATWTDDLEYAYQLPTYGVRATGGYAHPFPGGNGALFVMPSSVPHAANVCSPWLHQQLMMRTAFVGLHQPSSELHTHMQRSALYDPKVWTLVSAFVGDKRNDPFKTCHPVYDHNLMSKPMRSELRVEYATAQETVYAMTGHFQRNSILHVHLGGKTPIQFSESAAVQSPHELWRLIGNYSRRSPADTAWRMAAHAVKCGQMRESDIGIVTRVIAAEKMRNARAMTMHCVALDSPFRKMPGPHCFSPEPPAPYVPPLIDPVLSPIKLFGFPISMLPNFPGTRRRDVINSHLTVQELLREWGVRIPEMYNYGVWADADSNSTLYQSLAVGYGRGRVFTNTPDGKHIELSCHRCTIFRALLEINVYIQSLIVAGLMPRDYMQDAIVYDVYVDRFTHNTYIIHASIHEVQSRYTVRMPDGTRVRCVHPLSIRLVEQQAPKRTKISLHAWRPYRDLTAFQVLEMFIGAPVLTEGEPTPAERFRELWRGRTFTYPSEYLDVEIEQLYAIEVCPAVCVDFKEPIRSLRCGRRTTFLDIHRHLCESLADSRIHRRARYYNSFIAGMTVTDQGRIMILISGDESLFGPAEIAYNCEMLRRPQRNH